MLTIDVRDESPPAVTDGLSLLCALCRRTPAVDYRVTDSEWARVVPADARLGVVCLTCFTLLGGDVTTIEEVQVVGQGVTALFHPGRAYRWATAPQGGAT